MKHKHEQENDFLNKKHSLVCLGNEKNAQLEVIKEKFCGTVITKEQDLVFKEDSDIYLTGDIETLMTHDQISGVQNSVFVVSNFSNNFNENDKRYQVIGHGSVPLNINNVGVLIRDFFGKENYYKKISNEHKFQSLTESTKSGKARRDGLYITKVTKNENGDKRFHLLRCSSNFSGSTDNTKPTDEYIMKKTNEIAKRYFDQEVELNHVLAQRYHNVVEIDEEENMKTERKAVIKAHSDKTKDMPRNALMAFCTFYQNFEDGKFTDAKEKGIRRSNQDPFDFVFGRHNASALTHLRFRLKGMVKDESLVKMFDVIMYPNSVFMMSLTMNRLYTHEIVPSMLEIKRIPVRMGYVIRCSETEAVFTDGATHLVVKNPETGEEELVKLEKATKEGFSEVKEMYVIENATIEVVDYKKHGPILFSMNKGDYMEPDKTI